ncbi:hypothetical protein BABINDRAFT_167950 [Babjeviella inositovora NRRL Y-12698]|uniref:Multifunctional tryptophan biosynthesis protein n=1 Tax=Babjeviella inositovora NRRL Y-12698 TaxID=984486 RepID=A0A1E3QNU9_9ASCO|nr:uncharacterized protein BABINDRAFT_167950 [Babjeviella inositovora NRRL Y-12698]ODQ78762.1 hypothetical protein BABINDRAFT_167950 [Babjeviella inositovora NRRL Y-12698]
MASQLSKYVIMIDNYDSFTWNIYEYLCQEGARVDVFRNDAITLAEIEAKKPDMLLISPGPGHPKTDSGISRDAIDHFKGKMPIFGVCMGQQCMFEVFGGEVAYAGEIVHGKTSPITHDGKGIFSQVPQGIAITRYHSLAGTETSLPECLEVSAQTANGIIMGVRHKKYTIEGVQFHPESILTESGHLMIRNMLAITGGTWKEYGRLESEADASAPLQKKSILDTIYDQRKLDVAATQRLPGQSFEQLTKTLSLGIAPPQIDFYQRLLAGKQDNKLALAAEIKRASPSKGDIDIDVNAAEQAIRYARAGASAISVLTEPHYFKGSLGDLKLARQAVGLLENRPAILRKEFIFSKYQIAEARLAGADTVLLICKMLSGAELLALYAYSKSLGMEPLVEVNSLEELNNAVKLTGCKVIGVNNRDLHSFEVDLNTTSKLAGCVGDDVILLALSGVFSSKDARKYKGEGVSGVLVGEALMRAGEGVEEFARSLINA